MLALLIPGLLMGGATPVISPPVANFSGMPVSGIAPLSVAFADLSTNIPIAWVWEKNNGNGWIVFSTVQNPTETFASGTWSIRLTVTNASGSNAITKIDYIVVPPQPPRIIFPQGPTMMQILQPFVGIQGVARKEREELFAEMFDQIRKSTKESPILDDSNTSVLMNMKPFDIDLAAAMYLVYDD